MGRKAGELRTLEQATKQRDAAIAQVSKLEAMSTLNMTAEQIIAHRDTITLNKIWAVTMLCEMLWVKYLND